MPSEAEAAQAGSALTMWHYLVALATTTLGALGGAQAQRKLSPTPAPECPLNGRLDAVDRLTESQKGLSDATTALTVRLAEFSRGVDGSHERHTEMLGKVIEIQQQQVVVLTRLEERTPRN